MQVRFDQLQLTQPQLTQPQLTQPQLTQPQLRWSAAGHRQHTYECERYRCSWCGLIWAAGHVEGEPTVRHLLEELARRSWAEMSSRLRGTFALLVWDRESDTVWACTDNAGLLQLFYDDRQVSTDLFQMAESPGRAVSMDALLEMLALDTPHAHRTLLTDVRRLQGDELLKITRRPTAPATWQSEIVLKSNSDFPQRLSVDAHDDTPGVAHPAAGSRSPIQTTSERDEVLRDYFRELRDSFAGRKISLDLTSGTDSRLLASLMCDAGLDFEVAVSGRPGIPDVEIPRRLAQIMGKQLFVLDHDISTLGADMSWLLRATGGQLDMLRQHRLYQYQHQREVRGVELSIGGAGGELFKDFWWLHDLPFVPSSRVRFDRLYDIRITPQPLPIALLAPAAQRCLAHLRTRILREFDEYRGSTNTASYDNVYFFWRTPALAGPIVSMYAQHAVTALTPLMDRQLFEFARRLPVSTRLFHGYHRHMVSRLAPALAGVATEEGLTLRDGKLARCQDALAYGSSFLKRRIRKLGQKYLGRTWFQISPNSPQLIDTARGLPEFAQAVRALQANQVLAADVQPAQIPAKFVGRIMTAGLFIHQLELPVSSV